ncbi:hypothetical protein L7F22_062309 [Adiantum nelumboides]|nr:hypothetical protein [Adiantum nelumboides]
MPREIYEVATDPEIREANSWLGLRRYYEQEPYGVDFQRAYELMSSIKEDGHAMITDPQGEKVETVITKEIVADALKLSTEGLSMRAKDRKVEGVFKKDTVAANFNDINMRHVQDPTQLYQQHFHFAAKKPARYTTPNHVVASTFTQVLRFTSRPTIDHAQYVLNALKATKKEGKVTYLGAPEVLTRIAYHAIESSEDSIHKSREEEYEEPQQGPADSQDSSNNAEKRAKRREMMRTTVAAHQEEPAQKKAHHAKEKEAYERRQESAGATSALWSPTNVQPHTKNPKRRLLEKSVKLIQQMWEEAETARKKEAEEEMEKRVKAAQEAAFGSSSSSGEPPVSPPKQQASPPSPISQRHQQEGQVEEIPSTLTQLTLEKELPFINQPKKPAPLFPRITIIELPKEKRKVPMPNPGSSSSDKSYDIIKLESKDLELHEVQKPSQAPSPTTELPQMEEDKENKESEADTTVQKEMVHRIETTVKETAIEMTQELQSEPRKSPVKDAEAEHEVEIEKSSARGYAGTKWQRGMDRGQLLLVVAAGKAIATMAVSAQGRHGYHGSGGRGARRNTD